jgi:glutamine synthetase
VPLGPEAKHTLGLLSDPCARVICTSRKKTANRSAPIRIPVYHPGEARAQPAESRCPDPSANIYLCFAALLHAELEGIEKGHELPESMERSLYNLSADERETRGIETLPIDLGEAIREAENSGLV